VGRVFPDQEAEDSRRRWRRFPRVDRVYVNDRARAELGWTCRYDFRHVLDRLKAGRSKARMPRALVIAPPRELADQVAATFEKYAKGQQLSGALLIGGATFTDQEAPRMEVQMEEPVPMEVLHRPAGVTHHRHERPEGERRHHEVIPRPEPPQPFIEGDRTGQRRREEGQALPGEAQVEDGQDVRMGQAGKDALFLMKMPNDVRGPESKLQQLDRDFAF